MVRQCAFWTAAVLVLFAVTPAWAAEDVFHVIPSDALSFAVVNRIAETSGKVQKLAGQVGAPPVGLLDLAKMFTGVKEGLDEKRSAALIAMPGKSRESVPAGVLLIPVSDYKKFLASWNAKPTEKIVAVKIADQDMFAGNRGGYAAIAPKHFRKGLEKVLDAKRSVAEEYPQLVEWWTENDVTAVATSNGVKLASEAMQRQLQQFRTMFAEMSEDEPSPIMVLEMYAKALQWAEKEVGVVGIGARCDKQGAVHISMRTRFTKDSAFSASLAKLQPTEKGPLAGMPAGPFVVAGGGAWADSLTSSMMAVQMDFMKQNLRMAYGLDGKQADRFAKAALEMPRGVRSMSMIVGPGRPGEPILGDILALYGVDDSAKYLADYEKYIQGLNESGDKADAKAEKLYTVTKTKVDERLALEMEMAIPVPKKAKEMPGAEESIAKSLEKFFGPGGKFKCLLVAVDEHTVALSFAGRAPLVMRAIAALKQPADGLATDSDVAATAALLPKGSQWVGYVSPSGTVAFAKWIASTMSEEGGVRPNIPDFPASPPIGFAVKALPGELQAEAVASAAVIEAIGKYVGLVQIAEHPEVP